MVDNQTPNLLLRQESVDTYYGENTAKVFALPNPNLRWSRPISSTPVLTWRSFDYRLSFGFDGYYKHTRDAFNNTPVRRSTARTTM